LRLVLLFVVGFILGSGTILAQESTTPVGNAATPDQAKGAITGTVSDKSGAGVSGATVKVTSTSGEIVTATTDDQGLYAVADLAPGSYGITVEVRGSKIFEASMSVSPGQVLTVSVSGVTPLQPGANAGSPAAPPPSAAPGGPTESTPPVSTTPAMPNAPAITQVPNVANPAGASISGSVSDQTGAVIIGAEIKVTDSKGVTLAATSDSQGSYSVKGLAPDTYKVSVIAKGFKTFEAENITVAVGQQIPLDASLEPGQASTEVNVEGTKVAEVETESASVSGTITQKEVVKIGLNGRNFTQLIALAPGVSNQTGQDEAKVGVTGSVKYSVNGGRVEYNTFDVDGSDVLNAGLNGAESTLIVYPSLDAIQEVKVLTSNFGAMYGRTASGQVLVTTKEGGRQFHGNGYEFIRNEFFNARNYFDQTTKAPLYRRNDFGFTFGGPIFIPNVYNNNRDKTHFFVSEEFHYEKTPIEYNAAVPTLAERAGNFNDVCPPSFGNNSIPFSRSQFPDCPQFSPVATFPNNTVTQPQTPTGPGNSTIDANALAILNTNLIPLPNAASGCNSSLVGKTDPQTGQLIAPCYVATLSPATYWREDLFRIDQTLTAKMSAMFRYLHDSWDTTVLTPQWGAVRNTFPTVQNRFVGPGTNLVLRLTNTFSPSLLNEFVVSYTNSHITLTNQNGPGGASAQRPSGLSFTPGTPDPVSGRPQYPIGYFFNNGFGGKAPGIVIGGNNAEYGGNGFAVDPSYMPWEHSSPTLQWRDNLSKQWRSHTLQFGAQYFYATKSELNGAIGAATGDLQGILTFSNVNQGFQGNGTGNAFANFLAQTGNFKAPLSAIASFTQDSAQLRYYNRYTIAEPYFQDDWRVTPRLTLNLGLRLSLFGTYHEKYLRAFNFVPTAYKLALATQLRVDPGTGILLNNKGQSPKPVPLDLNNLDPRLTNGLVLCGVNGVPAGCMKDHLFNYAPRFGFAWDPRGNGKTSIRGGYGIFFEHGTGNEANTGSLEGSAPLVLTMTQRFPANYACIGGAAFALDQNPANCPQPAGAFPLNITSIPTTAVWPYAQQWSFSIQHELPKDMVATFAYVGSKGTNLTVQRQINQLHSVSSQLNPFAIHEPIIASTGSGANSGDCAGWTGGSFALLNGTVVGNRDASYTNLVAACQGILASGATPPDVNTLRPFIGFGQIYSLENAANSSYNAFQTTLRRTRGPLILGVSYTYSHSIDEASDRSDNTFVNTFDLASNRASSDFDQRHLLNVSYVYQLEALFQHVRNFWAHIDDKPDETGSFPPLPPLPGNKLSGLGSALWEGWELSGITTFQSGTPFSVVNGGGNNGIGLPDNAGVANGIGPGSFPDIVRGAPAPKSSQISGSFGPLLGNPSQFVAPRGLTFGDAGRNFLNNPHRLNFDTALLKHYKITERSELEFRAEAFNIFNHTQFRIFDPNNPGNSGNNVINCYGGANYNAGYQGPATDCLTGNSFLHPVDAHRPRTLQFGVKFSF
jgi:hypothetical protein